MRLLHAGPDHERDRTDRGGAGRGRSGACARRHERKPVPLRRVCRDYRSGARRTARPHRDQARARRMKNFDYVRPATISDAVAAAAEPGAIYLAAGTNLLDLMKGGVTKPDRLIDITHLPDLDRIEEMPDGAVRIGALVRNADLAHDRNFARRFPAVAEALLSGASAQLRNAATVGGNLLQRTRCSYFYDAASACNKRSPGAGCDARGGENRLHAVLGWSDACIATHASDLCVPLVALDALVEVEGRSGRRGVAVEALQRLPGTTPDRDSALEPGDLILALRLHAAAATF